MSSLVFLLEEPSARDLLEGLLPRLLPETIQFRFVVFEGKQDLEKNLARKIRGWLAPDTRFVVLRDQDAGDCREVRRVLVDRAVEAGRPDTLVRVACRDLEAWILGDLEALAEAFATPGLEKLAAKAKFRDPDALHHGVEEIRALVGPYQKRDGARRVGKLLRPERNQSRSFQAFCRGVVRLAHPPSG